MKEYTVEITEYLQIQLIIKAKNKEEALRQANELYNDGSVVLDYKDHTDTTIKIIRRS